MHAFASPEIINYVNASNALPDYPSSINSGILGDPDHYNANSYHIPTHHLPSPNGYTNTHPDDRTGSRDHVSADDMSMSTADMIKQWNRYLAVFNNRHNDPRAKYIAEYIGWNGVGSAERLDFQTGSRTNASADHKWHAHRANRRRYWNSPDGFAARLSIDKGETIAQYLGGGMPTVTDWRLHTLLYNLPTVPAGDTAGEPNELHNTLRAISDRQATILANQAANQAEHDATQAALAQIQSGGTNADTAAITQAVAAAAAQTREAIVAKLDQEAEESRARAEAAAEATAAVYADNE